MSRKDVGAPRAWLWLVAALVMTVATASPVSASGLQTHGPSVDIRSKRMHPPTYPTGAVLAGAAGTVTLRVDVDAKGLLQNVQVEASSGRDDLDTAAMDASRLWTYAPGRLDGQPVDGTLRIPVGYRLDP